MHVIGTAGHIDHGKSTLIRALTGIDPDRLKEEQARGMTIDLGFAWITLPSGREAGIVDVPGHHRFVRNMLAGAGGIDLVLFVVAATESWMPQSQEHLDIINLLGIDQGLVVLTKSDLVEPDWLEMVCEEVREKLDGTSLAQAQILPVSSVTGMGLVELKQAIEELLATTPSAPDLKRPRLWVDRAFTIRGSGTVVTGTLEGGALALEDQVVILPGGTAARVRGLQTHKRSVERAQPGSRVAINLVGVETTQAERGNAIGKPGQSVASDTINVLLTALPNLDHNVVSESEVKLYVGTAEIAAQVRLLDRSELAPGETALAQLQMGSAAAIQFQDRFVVRDPTRQETVGGGVVLDAQAWRVRGRDLRLPRSAPGAYRVLSSARAPVRRLDLSLLARRDGATAEELPLIMLAERGWCSLEELRVEVPLPPATLQEKLVEQAEAGQLVLLDSYAVDRRTWQELGERLRNELAAYHERYPLRGGMSRETLRSNLGMEPRLFEETIGRLVAEDFLAGAGAILRLPDFHPTFTPAQSGQVVQVVQLLSAERFSPPDLETVQGSCDSEVLGALVEQGKLIKVSKSLLYLDTAMSEVRERVASTIRETGGIEVGQMRDLFGTTRKYSVPILEYLDQIGFTRRVGDKRVLAGGPGS